MKEKPIEKIYEQAWKSQSLTTFTKYMRKYNVPIVYLMGKRIDKYFHKFFLINDDIAIGLSVLPEDLEKASKPAWHPNSIEMVIVIEGKISFEILQTINNSAQIKRVFLSKGDYFIIQEQQCHRVSKLLSKKAAFIFIKTKPKSKGGSRKCDNCINFNARKCTLRKRWLKQ
jgi:hypothetical protein